MSRLQEFRRQLKGSLLRTSRPLAGARAGQFKVRARGSGSDLDQLRDYQAGDDVRFIDWKSSARVQRVVVRDYRDERSRTVHLVCDISRSMDFGMGTHRISDIAQETALMLAVLCENAGDACGLFLADERVSMRLAASIGLQQTARIQAALSAAVSASRPDEVHAPANLGTWCAQLGLHRLRSSLLFLISDFATDIDRTFATWALPLARRHVVVAIRLRDESERYPGLLGNRWLLRDSEEAASLRLEAASDAFEAAEQLTGWRREQARELTRAGLLVCDLFSDGDTQQQLSAGLQRAGLLTRSRI
ncbi:MAG: DUF58 domain-containing protein [Candidatus Dependentiae bacterium]|nr:DUF58 domain-containing protein [Candidatus Dependentiae bacterium]